MRIAHNSRADDSSAAPRDSYSGGGGRGFGDSYDRGASRGGFRGGSSSGSRYGDDAGSGARGGDGFAPQRRPYQSEDAGHGGDDGADFMVRVGRAAFAVGIGRIPSSWTRYDTRILLFLKLSIVCYVYIMLVCVSLARQPREPSRADAADKWRSAGSGAGPSAAGSSSRFGGGSGGYDRERPSYGGDRGAGGYGSERGPSTCFNCGESGMRAGSRHFLRDACIGLPLRFRQ